MGNRKSRLPQQVFPFKPFIVDNFIGTYNRRERITNKSLVTKYAL